jgi:hypothetical protein
MSKSHLLPPPALLDFLAPYDHDIQQLGLAVRRFVIEHIPHMTEIIDDASNAVAMAYSPSGRFKEAICQVAVYPSYVNLGFNRGADLPDPGGHLQGTGKAIRHVPIRRIEDLLAPDLRALLAEAVKRAHAKAAHAGVIVRSTSGKKRRPLSSRGGYRLAKSAD